MAIAVRAVREDGLARRVLIVDLDHHHGNGNAEIFSDDDGAFTFSMHDNNWCWISKRHNRDVELPAHVGDEAYLEASLAVIAGCVHDGEGRTVPWTPGFQVFPLSGPCRDWFNSHAWAERVAAASASVPARADAILTA